MITLTSIIIILILINFQISKNIKEGFLYNFVLQGWSSFLHFNYDLDFFWKYYTGSILNVESATLKVSEGREKAVIDPDNTVCHENGGKMKRYTQIIRVFYVIGEPANETIGLVIFRGFFT